MNKYKKSHKPIKKTKKKKVKTFIFSNPSNLKKNQKEVSNNIIENDKVRVWCKRHKDFMYNINEFNERMLKEDPKYIVTSADVGRLLIQEGFKDLDIKTKDITKYWRLYIKGIDNKKPSNKEYSNKKKLSIFNIEYKK